MSADREPTAAGVLEWRRDDVFLPEAQVLVLGFVQGHLFLLGFQWRNPLT